MLLYGVCMRRAHEDVVALGLAHRNAAARSRRGRRRPSTSLPSSTPIRARGPEGAGSHPFACPRERHHGPGRLRGGRVAGSRSEVSAFVDGFLGTERIILNDDLSPAALPGNRVRSWATRSDTTCSTTSTRDLLQHSDHHQITGRSIGVRSDRRLEGCVVRPVGHQRRHRPAAFRPADLRLLLPLRPVTGTRHPHPGGRGRPLRPERHAPAGRRSESRPDARRIPKATTPESSRNPLLRPPGPAASRIFIAMRWKAEQGSVASAALTRRRRRNHVANDERRLRSALPDDQGHLATGIHARRVPLLVEEIAPMRFRVKIGAWASVNATQRGLPRRRTRPMPEIAPSRRRRGRNETAGRPSFDTSTVNASTRRGTSGRTGTGIPSIFRPPGPVSLRPRADLRARSRDRRGRPFGRKRDLGPGDPAAGFDPGRALDVLLQTLRRAPRLQFERVLVAPVLRDALPPLLDAPGGLDARRERGVVARRGNGGSGAGRGEEKEGREKEATTEEPAGNVNSCALKRIPRAVQAGLRPTRGDRRPTRASGRERGLRARSWPGPAGILRRRAIPEKSSSRGPRPSRSPSPVPPSSTPRRGDRP